METRTIELDVRDCAFDTPKKTQGGLHLHHMLYYGVRSRKSARAWRRCVGNDISMVEQITYRSRSSLNAPMENKTTKHEGCNDYNNNDNAERNERALASLYQEQNAVRALRSF